MKRATCVLCGGGRASLNVEGLKRHADCVATLVRDNLSTAAEPARESGCTGQLVHDEFTPCPVHDEFTLTRPAESEGAECATCGGSGEVGVQHPLKPLGVYMCTAPCPDCSGREGET